jgi:hypothetical protein
MKNEMKRTIEPSVTERTGLDVVLKGDGQTKESLYRFASNDQWSVPLFLRDSRNCAQGNAQDEKDATEE